MTWPSRTTFNMQTDLMPPPHDMRAMAEVLESRHGIHAAGVADFFSLYHGQKGDTGRAWAWTSVADLVRNREQERLGDEF